jgi:hypothetical protein
VLHFLTACKLKRPTDLYETPTGNQQRQWILIFGYMKDASNVYSWNADVSALLYAIWTVQVCRLSLCRLLGHRSSLLNRQHEIEFHLYFDEPRYWPATVRLEFDSGQGYLFLYLLKYCFLIRAAASAAVTVGHYPSMNETSRMRADDGGRPVVSWSRERVSLGPFMILFRLYAAWGPSCNSPRCCLNFFCPLSF